MAKKEKIVDLKSKPEKISENQLKKVQDTVNGINRAQLEIGTMELKKHEMLHGISGLREELIVLQKVLTYPPGIDIVEYESTLDVI